MLGGAAMTIIVAEQLCVKREMKEGLSINSTPVDEEAEDVELGSLLQRIDWIDDRKSEWELASLPNLPDSIYPHYNTTSYAISLYAV